MATIADIVTRVQRRVIDLPSAVQAEVQTLVEEAHRTLQDAHSFKVMERTVLRPTTVDSAELGAVPSDFKDYRGLPYYTDDLGTTYHFAAITHDREDVLRAFDVDTADIGRPLVLLHEDGAGSASQTWEVYPIPDGLAVTADGEYQVQVPYWAYLATPATNDWFTDNAHEFLIHKATAEAFALNWDEARYAFWLQKAAEQLRRVVNTDKRMRTSSVSTIVPRVGARSAGLAGR